MIYICVVSVFDTEKPVWSIYPRSKHRVRVFACSRNRVLSAIDQTVVVLGSVDFTCDTQTSVSLIVRDLECLKEKGVCCLGMLQYFFSSFSCYEISAEGCICHGVSK